MSGYLYIHSFSFKSHRPRSHAPLLCMLEESSGCLPMLNLISEPLLFRHFPHPNSALRQEWRKSDTHTFLLFRFLPSVNLWTTVQTKQRWMSNTQFIGSRSKSRKEDFFAVHCSRVNLMMANYGYKWSSTPYIVPCHLSTPWPHPHEVVRRLLSAAVVSVDEVFFHNAKPY